MESSFTRTIRELSDMPDFRVYTYNGDSILVLGYTDLQGNPRVRKLVTEMHDDCPEYIYAQLWYPFIGVDAQVSRTGLITQVDTPWLGTSLIDLTSVDDFGGLPYRRAESLLDKTLIILEAFYREFGLIYTDLALRNVLYRPDLDFFPIIDAESFARGDRNSWYLFYKRYSKFKEEFDFAFGICR